MGRLGSFLLGGAIGAGVALLFAPRAGEETRALIAEKADEYWGKGQTWYDQGRSRVQESVAGVPSTVARTGDDLREKIENARTLIAEQVAKNAAAARDAINDKVPVAAEKINQAADVVRGRIDTAASKIKDRATAAADKDGVTPSAPAAADKIEPSAPAATAAPDPSGAPAAPSDSAAAPEASASDAAAPDAAKG
ncbi:MAG: YtxH domain-containing protein [Coriobacteriales bacterium]|jgi:gas vesicle protein|nr:YtxH domain-containing protein [Coriobacteriales bacterium]